MTSDIGQARSGRAGGRTDANGGNAGGQPEGLKNAAGWCDGVSEVWLRGWAWKPKTPDKRAVIELWIDGRLEDQTVADIFRQDLLEGGIGDGYCAWSLRLWRRPSAQTSKIEVRVKGDGLLPNGTLDLRLDDPVFARPEPAQEAAPRLGDDGGARGACDGVAGGLIKGWAWRPEFPEAHVDVEQWVDGICKVQVLADLPRGDLAAARIGHARYGWSMPVALDPSKSGLQLVEMRIAGGGRMDGGSFWLKHDPEIHAAADASSATGSEVEDRVIGFYDGLKGSALHGWAWNPAHPDRTIEMELRVDGVLTATVEANGFRPDLRANGVGHGRYGWRLPVERDPNRVAPLNIEIRPKGGAPLPNGVFDLRNDLALDDPANAVLRPFVMSVLKAERRTPAGGGLPMPKTALLVHCPKAREAGQFWAREYDDYRTAMAYFEPVLSTLGDVIEVADVAEANAICAQRRAKAEDCILFSFGSPRQAPLDAECAVIPVFAWSFPSIPTGMWDGDRRSDWRYVFRTTGRAIALSEFAARAVMSAMGPDFPVTVVPVPVADRRTPPPPAPIAFSREITVRGIVLDTHEHEFDPGITEVPPPVWDGGIAGMRGKTSLRIPGVLFTAMLDLKDGRENWHDLITSFAAAHAGNPQATLLVRLSEPNPLWWAELYKWLCLAPRFTCRFILMRGEMDAREHDALVAASHWYVNVPKAAGLPLRLQEFLSAGRPAVSVAHTAMADHVGAGNALIVESDEEPWTWPDDSENEGWSWTQHPRDVGVTSRHRISWTSMREAFAEAYRLTVDEPESYAALSASAVASMRAFCGDAIVAGKIEAVIGPGSPSAQAARGPSPLLGEPPA